MKNPTNSSARCDRILALIDACLADVETGLRGIDGQGHGTTRRSPRPRHLTLIRS